MGCLVFECGQYLSWKFRVKTSHFCGCSRIWRCLFFEVFTQQRQCRFYVGFKWKLCGKTSNILRPFSCVVDIFVENGIETCQISVMFEDSFDESSHFTAIMLIPHHTPWMLKNWISDQFPVRSMFASEKPSCSVQGILCTPASSLFSFYSGTL